ncbi:MAG: alpha-N-arabinofuranosidase [Bacteroidales bacterium]|nr:alpha-N-arabinofuranosidase [Bacteroidales bacterium]
MKKLILILLIIIPLFTNAQKATIKIDIERVTGEIDPKIYGVFMEPIQFSGKRMGLPDSVTFNTLYGTLYDPRSPLSDENGFRKDYIEAMKELKITNMRWPGGNFVMGYDWKDGIGPKESRPARINLAWGGIDNNHVGTDEWFALNKAIGSENVVCANLGLGSILDAAYWVDYCNTKKGTWYADLRAKNGHPEPYNIKIWNLGNEVDGYPWELGHKSIEEYSRIGREAAKAMKAADNSIKLVASGSSYYESNNTWVDWNRKVLLSFGDLIDFISIHRYWERSDDYYEFMGQSAMDFEEKIVVTKNEIENVKVIKGLTNPVYISVDEWGIMARNGLSVLPIAQCFNSFIRHADMVKMANFTLLTSLLNSDRERGTYKTPLFYVFKSFSANCHGSSVDTYVDCDTFNTRLYKGIPYLDVTTVYSKENNKAYINVVNRSKEKAITADILSVSGEFSEKAVAVLVAGSPLNETFSIDGQKDYVPVPQSIKTNKDKITYSFPPHSYTQIEVVMKR